MPELPEVETVRRGLTPLLQGQTLAGVTTGNYRLRFPWPDDFNRLLEDRRVVALDRRAKYLLLRLDNGLTWLVHLGMSGAFHHAAQETFQPRLHDHLTLTTDSGLRLAYNDPRRFGFMQLFSAQKEQKNIFLQRLGVEPLSDAFTGAYLLKATSKRRTAIKTVLMQQEVVVGVGNIYASESLFRAGIHPATPAKSVTPAQCELLAGHVKEVLLEAIAAGGSTLRNHSRPDGELGCFQHTFCVYGRAGQPCIKRHAIIEKTIIGGRSSFWCPMCQPLL